MRPGARAEDEESGVRYRVTTGAVQAVPRASRVRGLGGASSHVTPNTCRSVQRATQHATTGTAYNVAYPNGGSSGWKFLWPDNGHYCAW